MRVLVACYTVLAIAATARAGVQLTTKLDEAPLPYLLTTAAAVVYLVLAVALRRDGAWRTVALAAATVELVGVLAVGAAELAWPDAWSDETVWSGFGRGYAFAPLVLPLVAIAVLRLRPRWALEPG